MDDIKKAESVEKVKPPVATSVAPVQPKPVIAESPKVAPKIPTVAEAQAALEEAKSAAYQKKLKAAAAAKAKAKESSIGVGGVSKQELAAAKAAAVEKKLAAKEKEFDGLYVEEKVSISNYKCKACKYSTTELDSIRQHVARHV